MSIIVGFVNRPEGHAAVEKGIEEALRRSVRLVVVNSMRGGSHEDDEDYQTKRDALDALRHELTSTGVEFEIHDFVRGQSPAEDLVDAVEEFDGELIVIGIRRRSTTGKLLLGSNALEVLHDADVPVLCVKALQSKVADG